MDTSTLAYAVRREMEALFAPAKTSSDGAVRTSNKAAATA
jgi:hypothetical protein